MIDNESTTRVWPKKSDNNKLSKHIQMMAQLKPLKIHEFGIMFANADQLSQSKILELKENIVQQKPMIIAVCEVKPKNSKDRTLEDYKLPGFSLHEVNIQSKNGRGIAVYAHHSIDNSVVQGNSHVTFEEVCLLEIRLKGGDKLLFGCFYRSPTPNDTAAKNNQCLSELLKNLSKKQYSHICFVGDFNFRDINWDSWSTNHNENSKEHKFIETIRDCFLHQHNHINSRHRGNEQPSLLDLILSNETMQVSDVAHHPPLGKSDHNVITFNFNCYVDYSKPKEVFRYDKADFEAMRQNIRDTSWKTKYITSVKNKNVEKLWEDLKSKIHEMRDKFVPKIKQHDQPTWKEKGGYPINTALKDAIHKKRVMHRQWMVSTHFPNSESARLGYTRARTS